MLLEDPTPDSFIKTGMALTGAKKASCVTPNGEGVVVVACEGPWTSRAQNKGIAARAVKENTILFSNDPSYIVFPVKTPEDSAFCFSYKDEGFTNQDKDLLLLLREVYESQIERQRHHQVIAHMQRLSLIGTSVAMFSHEARNMLAIAKGFVEVTRFPEGQESKVSDIKNALEKLHTLSQSMLYISKSVSEQKRIDLAVLVQGAVRFIQPYTIKNNNDIQANYSSAELPVLVRPQEIEQVVLNLIINSVQSYGAVPGTVKIETGVKDNTAFFSVADRGKGFIDKKKAFELFYTTKPEGTGLGLPISFQIIKDHKGSIVVEDNAEEGIVKGSVITVYLPRNL